MNSKISAIYASIDQLKAKFNLRIKIIEISWKDKINFDEMKDIQERLEKLENYNLTTKQSSNEGVI